MSLFHHEDKKDPVLLIVKTPQDVEDLRRTLDPDLVFVVCMHMGLMGHRFSAIINTVSIMDYESAIEQLQFQQWITEYIPTKHAPPVKPIIHLNGTP